MDKINAQRSHCFMSNKKEHGKACNNRGLLANSVLSMPANALSDKK